MFGVLAIVEILNYCGFQSQIPHIKPPCFQVCWQIWHFVVNLSVCIVHFQVIWGPGKIRLKWMNWGRPPPPRTDIVRFFYRFSHRKASLRAGWRMECLVRQPQHPAGVFAKTITPKKTLDLTTRSNTFIFKSNLLVVNGGWSTWSNSGACSRECGGGTTTRTRQNH